jgi:hypothetical protein
MSLHEMAQQSQHRRRADSNRWTRRDARNELNQAAQKPRTLDGFPHAFATIALTAAIIPFGYWAALGLLVLVVLTPAIGKRKDSHEHS